MRSSGKFLSVWLVYITFVVYGSLLPFEYQPLALGTAIEGFRHIPFLQLGIESRADWVANGVLYVPVGLLTARVLDAALSGRTRTLAVGLAVAFGAVLAFMVEFTQLYFPPRTVSQNDLIAECIGTAIGAVVAPFLLPWAERLLTAWVAGGQRLMQRLLEAYAVIYILFCLFPFDLLLSVPEWQDKIASDLCGWVMADASLQRGWLSGGMLVVELMLAMPFGMLLALRRGARVGGLGSAVALGCGLGLAIELGQLGIASGITQGASVLTRGAGMAMGVWAWRLWSAHGVAPIKSALQHHTHSLGLVYLALLLGVSGWFDHPQLDAAAVSDKWAALHLMPLYYHYYTTEAIAVFSLASVALMYLPVAVIGWARQWRLGTTLGIAGPLALLVEAGKLMLAGLHPDPTNAIIAMGSCWLAFNLLALLERPPLASAAITKPVAATTRLRPAGPGVSAKWSGAFTGFAVLCAAGLAATLPTLAWPVLAILLGSATLVWRWPVLALALVPAALPVFDLAPWTGRFFLDEFDLLLLVVLTVGWQRTQSRSPPPGKMAGIPRLSAMLLALFGISLAISTLSGLLPWQWPDQNSFNSYYSGYNALRIAKGAVWTLGFIAVYRRLAQPDADKMQTFAWGMSAGLLLTVATIIWERLAFVGLFDFSATYRVTGPFSAMHTGGAYIECYLALATAFVLWLVLRTPHLLVRWLGAGLLLCATYALMVTYSRNGYAALLAVVLVMVGAALLRPAASNAAATRQVRLTAILAGVAILAVATPVLLGQFAMQRLAAMGHDQSVRVAHWQDALRMRDGSWANSIFGEGLGRFPAAHYWRSAEPVHAASYGLATDKTGTFLRLGTGAAVYIEQFVNVRPGERYRLLLDIRADGPATLGVALCEKWMLTSTTCDSLKLDVTTAPSGWHHASATLSTQGWPQHPWYGTPPVKLSIYSSNGPSTIDVAHIRLETEAGSALLANGNFQAGLDRWFFSTDIDPPWHIHSLPVTILFEQGWLGFLAWATAIAMAIGVAAMRTWRGDSIAAPVLAALLAMLVSGVANTLIDAPRFLGLMLVLMWLGGRVKP